MSARPATTVRQRALRNELLDLIEQVYPSRLGLSEAVRFVGTSRRQAQRVLEPEGWRELLTQKRLDVARELLRTTSDPVGVIGVRVGYRQASQFAKTFRQHVGMSPSEYRRRNR